MLNNLEVNTDYDIILIWRILYNLGYKKLCLHDKIWTFYNSL